MKNAIKALVLVAIFAVAGIASAQNSATTNGTATARIIRPVTITKTCDLAYGNVIGGTNGTVVMTPAGVATYSPAGIKPGTQVGTQSAACFTATGEPTFQVNITRTSSATLTSFVPGGTLTVNAFTTNAPANPITLGVTGTVNYNVGGTLNMVSSQPTGSYSTSNTGGSAWTETVAYN